MSSVSSPLTNSCQCSEVLNKPSRVVASVCSNTSTSLRERLDVPTFVTPVPRFVTLLADLERDNRPPSGLSETPASCACVIGKDGANLYSLNLCGSRGVYLSILNRTSRVIANCRPESLQLLC